MADGNPILAVVPSIKHHDIRLTYRQWIHIIESHDYMAGNREKILETIVDPDQVIEGATGESIALRHYDATNITEKTFVAIYRDEPDGFVITSFLTSRPDKVMRKGKLLWTRPPLT